MDAHDGDGTSRMTLEMPQRVLVTGAGGFIGSRLIESLVARDQMTVRALVRTLWHRVKLLSQAHVE